MNAIAAARSRDAAARVPFVVGGRAVGSVARVHLPLLREWRGGHREHSGLQVHSDHVALTAHDRDAALGALNAALRRQGLIRAWRDETFPLLDPTTAQTLALMERAATRFWGTLTLGAHANGYVVGDEGRPAALWIAQRSFSKPTDAGLHDNLVGGGVAAGQTPYAALLREAWEEAGLAPSQLQALQPGRVLRLHRDIPEGLQLEDLHAWDLALPADWQPQNQDGEVAGFTLMPVEGALALALGDTMTVDAALVTIDFGLRHALFTPALAATLSEQMFANAEILMS